MRKTYTTKKTDIVVGWHQLDAKGRVLGKIASEASKLLIGKHKPIYTPTMNVGDKVVIVNSDELDVSSKKLKDKLYHRYTGYPGGIKTQSLEKLMKKNSTEVIRKAIAGMLPRNKLHKQRMANLYIYKGSEHPHGGQIKG
ncbi:50S ribosomal protein L13 [Patescibacteria group bacterium]